MDKYKPIIRMNDILISVIVPVYNSEKTLPRCLESLIGQTYSNMEIICVNDCSTDKSEDIIRDYMTRDIRIRLINHAENTNAGGARNDGIKAAKGFYICLVDNDDRLALNAIETMVSYTKGGMVDIVVPRWVCWYEDKPQEEKQNLIVGGTREENIRWMYLNGMRVLGCLYKRALIVDNGAYFPERIFWEDNGIIGLWLNLASTITAIDDVCYYYHVTSASSSRAVTLNRVVDRIRTTDLFVENLKRYNFYEKDKELVDCTWLGLTCATVRQLGRFKFRVAKPYIREVASKIRTYLPNPYFKRFPVEQRFILKYPILSRFLIYCKHKIKNDL